MLEPFLCQTQRLLHTAVCEQNISPGKTSKGDTMFPGHLMQSPVPGWTPEQSRAKWPDLRLPVWRLSPCNLGAEILSWCTGNLIWRGLAQGQVIALPLCCYSPVMHDWYVTFASAARPTPVPLSPRLLPPLSLLNNPPKWAQGLKCRSGFSSFSMINIQAITTGDKSM